RRRHRRQEAAVRMPRRPPRLRNFWSRTAGMGHARRLCDSRHHAGGRSAHARGACLMHARRSRSAPRRQGATRLQPGDRHVVRTEVVSAAARTRQQFLGMKEAAMKRMLVNSAPKLTTLKSFALAAVVAALAVRPGIAFAQTATPYTISPAFSEAI